MAVLETKRIRIDSSALIAYLRNREPGATAVERAVQTTLCFVAAITVYELIFGLARSGQPIGEDELLGAMTILPMDEAVARRAAFLHNSLLKSGQDIGIKDVLVAASCLTHQIPLLTLNDRHFVRVPGLDVITPSEFIHATS